LTDPARSTVRAGSCWAELPNGVGRVPSAGYQSPGWAGETVLCPVLPGGARRPVVSPVKPGIIPPGDVSSRPVAIGEWDSPDPEAGCGGRVTRISLTMSDR